jgi:Mg-chelatase subunit ChlD
MAQVRASIRIVGHYNPFGDYPSHVVSIYIDSQQRPFAIYRREFRLLDASVRYVVHQAEVAARIGDFRAGRHSLFAFDERRVVRLSRQREEQFYSDLLTNDEVSAANPFFLLRLAARVNDGTAILKAARCCIAEFGVVTDFARDWYYRVRSERAVLRDALPPEIESITAESKTLHIACSLDKERALQRLARRFNWSTQVAGRYTRQVAISSHDMLGLQDAIVTRTAEAVSPGIEDWPADIVPIQLRRFTQGQLVLAVNPAVRRPELDEAGTTWRQAFHALLNIPDFRWLKPRAHSKSGQRLAYGMLAELSDREVIALESRVEAYCRDDTHTISRAFEDGEWAVSAFVAQEHSIRELTAWLPPHGAPQIVRSNSPAVTTEQYLALLGGIEDLALGDVFEAFAEFATSDSARVELAARGFVTADVEPVSEALLHDAARRISRFEANISVCLIVDVSGSMEGEKLARAKTALGLFMGQLAAERGDIAALVSIRGEPAVEVSAAKWIENREKMADRVSALTANGQTALIDGILVGWQQVAKAPGIRTLIVVTDGLENSSRTSQELALRMVTEGGSPLVSIYGLAYGDDADYNLLQTFSRATGGETYRGSVENIQRLFGMIAGSL